MPVRSPPFPAFPSRMAGGGVRIIPGRAGNSAILYRRLCRYACCPGGIAYRRMVSRSRYPQGDRPGSRFCVRLQQLPDFVSRRFAIRSSVGLFRVRQRSCLRTQRRGACIGHFASRVSAKSARLCGRQSGSRYDTIRGATIDVPRAGCGRWYCGWGLCGDCRACVVPVRADSNLAWSQSRRTARSLHAGL